MIALPMSFRIIYGFMSDNVQIMGSNRRGHIIANSICCICAMTALITVGTHFGKYFVTTCVMISILNMCYSDTVTDALTVQASIKGGKDIGALLNGISFGSNALGAVSGSVVAFIYEKEFKNPTNCFLVYLLLQVLFLFLAIQLNDKKEDESEPLNPAVSESTS